MLRHATPPCIIGFIACVDASSVQYHNDNQHTQRFSSSRYAHVITTYHFQIKHECSTTNILTDAHSQYGAPPDRFNTMPSLYRITTYAAITTIACHKPWCQHCANMPPLHSTAHIYVMAWPRPPAPDPFCSPRRDASHDRNNRIERPHIACMLRTHCGPPQHVYSISNITLRLATYWQCRSSKPY